MYRIEEYKIATYSKAKYGKTPSRYIVPEKIVKYDWDQDLQDFKPTMTYRGRTECGNLISDVRAKHKEYMLKLDIYGLDDFYTEMTKHKNKEGFWTPANQNYNAERMVKDDGFMPIGQRWWKKSWNPGIWREGSPVPNYNEPYWHTEHSIVKSNDWIKEHLDHMSKRVHQKIIDKNEYGVIQDLLHDCIIDIAK